MTAEGKNPFRNWLHALHDVRARAKIRIRLIRVRLGNFGDAKSVGDGVSELRIPCGPGYRVYFAQMGSAVVLLLCGGDKSTQNRALQSASILVGLPTEVVMKTRSVNYEDGLKKDLADSDEAAAYLNAALEDGAQDVFLMALRDVADAHGLTRLARETSLNRENMYRILSGKGNPQLSSLKALLDSLGLKLAVKAKQAVA